MKTHASKGLFAVALALGLTIGISAHATLLVYEPFDYTTGTASGSGVRLAGQSGGTGFASGSSWSTFNTGTANSVTVYKEGNLSGVNTSTGAANVFDGTVDNLTTSGGYFGSVGLGGTANTTDHIEVWRALDPAVTATFVEGATTWFSFVSTRAFNANATSARFAIGAAELKEDRGHLANGEAIGVGGGLQSNTLKVFPQFWDDTETVGTYNNHNVAGVQVGTGASTTNSIAAADCFGWQGTLPDGTTYAAPNIIVGKIEWHDGSPDVISIVRFLQTDTLSEANFNTAIAAQPNLCSANWLPARQPNLDQSQFDTVSIAGGRFFADEIRIATTFDEAVGKTVVVAGPFRLTIARNAPNLVFTWTSQSGRRYNLRSSTDLTTPPSTWPLVEGATAIAADPSGINTLTIPQPADPMRFYVAEEYAAPAVAIFADSFDPPVDGWTNGVDVDVTYSNTSNAWQLGSPLNVGPLAANSPPNCYATNIASNYNSTAFSNIWLRTPPIDLRGYSLATLKFNQFKDIETSAGDIDAGEINILSASTGSVLAVMQTGVKGTTTAWEGFSKDLPPASFAEPIRIEFRFKNDDFDSLIAPATGYAGWYIDDVQVLVPGS